MNSVYKYYENIWNNSDDKNGNDLSHFAFSLNKVINSCEIDENEKFALISALYQSGKTFVITAVAAIYLSMGYTPIIVAPKSKQAIQCLNRIKQSFVDVMKNVENVKLDVLYNSSKNPIDDKTKFENAMNGTCPKCIVTFAHTKQIRYLCDLYKNNTKIILFIDEAHKCGGYKNLSENSSEHIDENVKYDNDILLLKELSKKVILISATAANILWSEFKLYSNCIFNKLQGPGYRGPTSISYNLIKNDASEIHGILLHLSLQDPEQRFSQRNNITDRHPHILLCHAWRKLQDMKEMYNAFIPDIKSDIKLHNSIINANWLVCTFFGEGIKFWHKSLYDTSIEINDEISIDNGTGEHYFSEIEISDMLYWLSHNGGVDRFPRIIIFSYDMAYESISFSSHLEPYWHLNKLVAIGTHSSANMAQLVHRLSGNHYDNLSLECWTSLSNKKKTIKEVELYHDYLIAKIASENISQSIPIMVHSESIFDNRIPTKFLVFKKKYIDNYITKKPNPDKKKEEKVFKQHKNALDIFHSRNPELYKHHICTHELEKCYLVLDNNTKYYTEFVSILLEQAGTNVFVSRENIIKKMSGLYQTNAGQITKMVKMAQECDKNTPGLVFMKVGANKWSVCIN